MEVLLLEKALCVSDTGRYSMPERPLHTLARLSASPLDDDDGRAHQARKSTRDSVSRGDLVNANRLPEPMDGGRKLIYVTKLRNETMRSSLKERKTWWWKQAPNTTKLKSFRAIKFQSLASLTQNWIGLAEFFDLNKRFLNSFAKTLRAVPTKCGFWMRFGESIPRGKLVRSRRWLVGVRGAYPQKAAPAVGERAKLACCIQMRGVTASACKC